MSIHQKLEEMKINKVNLTAGICIGSCFACAPLYHFDIIGKPVLFTVFGIALVALAGIPLGYMRKIFPPKK